MNVFFPLDLISVRSYFSHPSHSSFMPERSDGTMSCLLYLVVWLACCVGWNKIITIDLKLPKRLAVGSTIIGSVSDLRTGGIVL